MRADAVGADELAGVADQLALLALADVDAAVVADLLVRIAGVGGAVDAVGSGPGLVDLAVAVVVDAVADFGAGADAALADGLAAAARIAAADAGLALALGAVTGVDVGVVGRGAGPAEAEAVVDGAVAVVVLAVADLGGGLDAALTLDGAVDAGGLARRAGRSGVAAV